MPATSEGLVELLTLEPLGDGVYRGRGPRGTHRRGRLYGGEILAQALRAAQAASAGSGRAVSALHASFLRPGDAAEPVDYTVTVLRDGRSFSLRRVAACQGGVPIASADISFHLAEPGPQHDAPMPAVPPPEALPDAKERLATAQAREPRRFGHLRPRASAFDERFVEDLYQQPPLPPAMHVWVRALAPVPDAATAAAMALYYSDDPIMDNALLPHAPRFDTDAFMTTSLDHAMWFHRPFDVGAWHLFAQDSPVASGARAFTRGTFHDRSGRVVASVAQEILLRPR
jgi:acyl-CoA thioesterase-2